MTINIATNKSIASGHSVHSRKSTEKEMQKALSKTYQKHSECMALIIKQMRKTTKQLQF